MHLWYISYLTACCQLENYGCTMKDNWCNGSKNKYRDLEAALNFSSSTETTRDLRGERNTATPFQLVFPNSRTQTPPSPARAGWDTGSQGQFPDFADFILVLHNALSLLFSSSSLFSSLFFFTLLPPPGSSCSATQPLPQHSSCAAWIPGAASWGELCPWQIQKHRLVWVGRDFGDHLIPTPCHRQGLFLLAQESCPIPVHGSPSSLGPSMRALPQQEPGAVLGWLRGCGVAAALLGEQQPCCRGGR